MRKIILGTKLDILEFIMRRKLTWPYELVEKFGYSPRYVPILLNRLKRAGLVINMTRGCWELTEEGYRRHNNYQLRDKKQ